MACRVISFWIGCIALSVASAVGAEPSPPPAKIVPLESLVKPLLGREIVGATLPMAELQRYCEARVLRMPKVSSVAEWESQAAAMRAGMFQRDRLSRRGRDGATPPAKVEWLDTIAGGPGYRIKKLRYEALPGLWIPALLYEPEKLAGKVPVVLNVNGHVRPARQGLRPQADPLHQPGQARHAGAERRVARHGPARRRRLLHYRMNQLDLCGTSGLAVFYLSMKRGLDILLSLPTPIPSAWPSPASPAADGRRSSSARSTRA